MEISIIKNDVITELKTERYYNELEISRLVLDDPNLSHRQRISKIKNLTLGNSQIEQALALLERYFPVKQDVTPVETVG